MVYGCSLENCRGRKATVGSNPTPSILSNLLKLNGVDEDRIWDGFSRLLETVATILGSDLDTLL